MSPKGGARPGAGRPKLEGERGDKLKRITIRVSPKTHEKLKKISGYNGMIRTFLETL
jgi:hypothetical protein